MNGFDAPTVLRRARALISDPERWTQGQLARAETGQGVRPTDPRACEWCVAGAIMEVAPSHDVAEEAAALLRSACGHTALEALNDTRLCSRREAHQRVLAALDRAAELAEAGAC